MIIETDAGNVSLEQVGAGPDIVLLHSLLSDRNVFAPIVPALAANHRVNLVDLPGFGSTSLIEADMNAYGDMIGSLLQAGPYDPATTCILGNGLGAFVALATAIRHGSAFDKLVVAGGGAGFTEAGKGAFRGMIGGVEQGGMEGIIEVAIRRIFPEDYLGAHPDQAEERRAVLRRTDTTAFVAACTALLGLDYFEASKSHRQPDAGDRRVGRSGDSAGDGDRSGRPGTRRPTRNHGGRGTRPPTPGPRRFPDPPPGISGLTDRKRNR